MFVNKVRLLPAAKLAIEGSTVCAAHIAGQTPHQQLSDLPGTPMRLLLSEPHDHCLHRLGQLVGVTHRPSRPVRQHLPPKGEKCYRCLRYETSPISQVGQSLFSAAHGMSVRAIRSAAATTISAIASADEPR